MNAILKDPQYASLLALVKAARNGAVYGAKVRFPHALVYVMLAEMPPYIETMIAEGYT